MHAAVPILSLACLFACDHPSEPEEPAPKTSSSPNALTSTIAALDSAMFSAFNAHDAAALGTWFTPDLEFYHDKSGIAGYDSTMAGFTRLFSQPATADIRREIVPGTLEVYPLGDFGLLEICQHRFCHTENGQEDCGTFKNIMVWRKEGASYKVSRVISYDH
ncbi:MAG TPA: nuclear transport factor 2 family protein [Flavobacteriales bacterium]|nr:nuclear transport factor 2 family protein [Flavobacteriales bacterium]